MDSKTPIPFLVFDLHGKLYGIKTKAVREIVMIPELTPCVEAPAHVVGEFNFRGSIVPVIDLDIKFGQTPRAYSVNDMIIVLDAADTHAGIIVNNVCDVRNIASDLQTLPGWLNRTASFIEGEALDEAGLITILNADELATRTSAVAWEPPSPWQAPARIEAAPEEVGVLAERARNLSRSAGEERPGFSALAAIRLADEYFGVELSIIREFAEIPDLAPVPCCPAHITGNMNLRGDILTVIDVRVLLRMAPGRAAKGTKAVVVETEGRRAGVLADEVCEVIYPRKEEFSLASPAWDPSGEGFVAGTVRFREKLLCVLDLRKILESSSLCVDEEVQA